MNFSILKCDLDHLWPCVTDVPYFKQPLEHVVLQHIANAIQDLACHHTILFNSERDTGDRVLPL